MKPSLQGKTALVTGASSGLGRDFARELARRGCALILVARRSDRLREVQMEITSTSTISSTHTIPIETIPADLNAPEVPRQLYERLQASNRQVDVLINNAGVGLYGEFAQVPWEQTRDMIQLDVLVMTEMMRLFIDGMVKRNFGYILNVASIGAFQPSPTYAVYSAAKSYVFNLTEAVHYELRHTGVKCTVINPGVTRTEFLAVAGQTPTVYQRTMMMDSAAVARIGIQAMLRGRASVTPGLPNTLFAFMMRFLPYQFQARLADLAMRM